MLAELKQAHEQLLAAIGELERLTGEDAPDAGKLAPIRWKLSRASGRRRKLVDEACDAFKDGEDSRAESVRALRGNGADMLTTSSKHIGSWTIEQVMRDWDGYRAASGAMRTAMRARIEAEKAILYPLLSTGRTP